MSSPSRTAQFSKLHKILKKYYSPVEPDPSRPVLEQLLYASLLENAQYAATEDAYAALVHGFFDWNEIRVSTVRELAEVMSGLPDPPAAASRVKRILQNVFEATYAFDLEDLRKQNLGPAVERLKKIDGASDFAVSYVVQAALAGHAIPIDSGTLGALYAVDLVTQEDVAAGTVPGLERAIAKSKGGEFGSLLHHLGADFTADPYSSHLREILLQVDPRSEERLPKRRVRRSAERTPVDSRSDASPGAGKSQETPTAAEAQPAGKSPAKEKAVEKTVAERKKKSLAPPEDIKASSKAAAPPTEASAPGSEAPAAEDADAAARKKPAATKKKPIEKKKGAAEPKPKSEPETPRKKADPSELAKRKPR